MKIVISGVGEMGSHLARMLSGNGHEITVIDSDQKLLNEVESALIPEIVEQIVTDIFMAAASNW